MGLEVFFPQDIRNVLLAADQSASSAFVAAGGEENEFALGYQEGYRAALTTVALAFGLIRPDGACEGHGWQPTFLLTTPGCNGKNGQR